MPADNSSLQQLSAAWATFIARAERPSQFSSRDGSILRLVPVNERLPQDQLQGLLMQLLSDQRHLLESFQTCLPRPDSRGPATRRTAAWARGWGYLQAGNNRQALKDANTAMAYAAAAAGNKVTRTALQPAAPSSPAVVSMPSVTVAEGLTSDAGNIAAEHSSCTNTTAASGAVQASKEPATTTTPKRAPGFPTTSCSWVPALLLAAECHAAMGNVSQAVILLAQAAQQAPGNTVVADRLAALTRQLTPEQSLAWRSEGLPGLLQQLQDEAELKLPEVMRPRPKWYYYNKWMTQRVHTALLELHLRCPLSSGGQLEGSSSEQLLLAAEAAADSPAIAAAAAAAGFATASVAAARDEVQQEQPGLALQLPGPVIDKLLSLDAGDLDLMIKHPNALQAQVYELLDVLQLQGTAALEGYAVPHLSWEEVQVLAANPADNCQAAKPVVGLALGYSAPQKQPELPAGVVAVLPAPISATEDVSTGIPALEPGPMAPSSTSSSNTCKGEGVCPDRALKTTDNGSINMVVPKAGKAEMKRAGRSVDASVTRLGWRQQGWRRSDYLIGRN